MLTSELADVFLKRYMQYIPYQIHIMNDKGIIIAGSEKSKIGIFSELAYKILKTDNLMILTDNDTDGYLGTRYGVYSAVLYKGEKAGVVGLTGNPYEVRDMISLIRVALEQTLEYELARKDVDYRGNLRTQFIHMLLYEDTIHTQSELSFLASQLGYATDLLRVPILINCPMSESNDYTAHLMERCGSTDPQDIVIKMTTGQVLVFKNLEASDSEAHRGTIMSYLKPILDEIPSDIPVRVLIGSYQKRLSYYRSAYHHCLWLQNQLNDNINLAAADNYNSGHIKVYCFYDNIGRYIKDITPLIEFHRIYNGIVADIDDEMTQRIIETIETLQKHNYNMNSASKDLNIHKNTLIFRFNKIKNALHINPVQNAAEREFMEYFCYYLSTPQH